MQYNKAAKGIGLRMQMCRRPRALTKPYCGRPGTLELDGLLLSGREQSLRRQDAIARVT